MLIPWENVVFYRHTKAATFIRATLHRYSAFAFVQRTLKLADMMIGAAPFNVAFVQKSAGLSDRVMPKAGPCSTRRRHNGSPRRMKETL